MKISKVSWIWAAPVLGAIRRSVFILGQQVPEEDEWDGKDHQALHYLVINKGKAIGCARLVIHDRQAKIGRVAILQPWRNRGFATALMQQLAADCKAMGCTGLKLDAQHYIVGWYEQLGFKKAGDPFMDAGILHQHMTRPL